LANRQTSVSSAFVTASAAVSQPTSAPVKLPAEFDELSKFPCKVYYWNNDDPSNLHWVPMGHATLELKIETEVKSQVLIYAVPYTGRPMFGATLTPHFTFNVASEDPVEINPIKLLMRINMQLAKFNGEQFDGKCRMVSVKIKGQDRVRRWSKLVKALMAAAGELNNDNDEIADDVDEKEEEDEDVSNSSCISHKDSDVEASYWSASASGSSNSSISADENAFESASQRNIDLNTDEMPAKQSIDKQSAKFEGLEQVSCEARRNIARINEEIKQLFSSKETLSLPADCEASADKLKEENLAVMGMGGQSTDDENDSPDDDSLSQTSFAGFQLIESDGEDLDGNHHHFLLHQLIFINIQNRCCRLAWIHCQFQIVKSKFQSVIG
jgi:hypothetical protein